PAAALGKGGPPDGKGYGGGGGKSDEGVLYGDLYVVLRDGNGKPILDPENFDCPTPVLVDASGDCQGITMVFDEEALTCGIPLGFEDLVMTVETGRLSVSRTTDSVFEHAYIEAIKNISYADTITLDPAFRLLLTFINDDTGEVEHKTIDSPLENLAMYQTLMKYGYFPLAEVTSHDPADTSITIYDPTANLVANSLEWLAQRNTEDPLYPADPDALEILETHSDTDPLNDIDAVIQEKDLQSAVSFIAAGADKGGRITVDMLVNINANLGLNGDDPLNMVYFDFSPFGQDYLHQNRYKDKDDVDLLVGPEDGFPEGQIWFQVLSSNIGSEVPFEEASSCKELDVGVRGPSGPAEGGEADFFTQAADDARAVIEFLHNWSIPEY
ncbi:hypothetical protein MUP29_03370, partial [bacterium]|nr:hypothetical protein [bacterium]